MHIMTKLTVRNSYALVCTGLMLEMAFKRYAKPQIHISRNSSKC